MLISTIVICRNSIRYIERCIKSIRAQGKQTNELIVIDGSSVDGTAGYLLSQSGLIVINQSGTGIANARNQGILAAGGNFIAFLDSDDSWSPVKLQLQYRYLHNNPDVDAVGAQLVKSDDPDRAVPSMTPGGFLFRREVFDRFGLFNEQWKFACDHEWFLRSIRTGLKYHMLPDVLMTKQMHNDSYSTVYKNEYRKEMMEIFRSSN